MINSLSAQKPLSVKAWAGAIANPAREFGPTPLSLIQGAIPAGLRGSLYRNGPACFQRRGQQVGHWFDGDGAVLAIHFPPQTAGLPTGVYRYVQTAGYQAEEKAGQFLFGGYGMTPSGPIWQKFARGVKNAANTSVMALPDKLLALWEGGQPHAMDLQTLETLGIDNLDGLKANWHYSAHPKYDPQTGEIYNFGVTPGKNATLQVYRSSSTGKLLQSAAIPLKGVPLIHDFVLAGKYLVFFIPPLQLQVLPVLLQQKSYSDSLMWRPELATQILIIDRDTLQVVSQMEAEPWYQWHFSNGFVDSDGSVVVDFVRYEDFATNQLLKEVASGKTQTPALGTLWRSRFDPDSGKVLELQELSDRSCEFPTVAQSDVSQAYRFSYLAVHRIGVDIGQERYDAIARFDHHTGILTEANLGDNRYPSEPIYAPDAENPARGWILTVVFDGDRTESEVWIFDSDRLDSPPVCRLALPSFVPLGFHGCWKNF